MASRGQDIQTSFFYGTREVLICHLLAPLSALDCPVPCVQKGGHGQKCTSQGFPLTSAETHEKLSKVGKRQMLIQASDTE